MKNKLENFLGGRLLTMEVKDFLLKNQKMMECPLYRGLPYPKHLLYVGQTIEEWYGSSHWSKDKEVAIDFSNDYINEDYEEELLEERDEVEFISLVLVLDKVQGIDMEPFILHYGLFEDFGHEKEVTVLNKDFEIVDIKEEIISGEYIYFAKVIAKNRNVEGR